MNDKELDGLLSLLSEAPESQLCKTVTKRIKAIIGKPPSDVSEELKRILDDCANYSLASDFAMVTLHIAFDMATKENNHE